MTKIRYDTYYLPFLNEKRASVAFLRKPGTLANSARPANLCFRIKALDMVLYRRCGARAPWWCLNWMGHLVHIYEVCWKNVFLCLLWSFNIQAIRDLLFKSSSPLNIYLARLSLCLCFCSNPRLPCVLSWTHSSSPFQPSHLSQ